GQVSWYPILPVAFYKHIVDISGLKPVFVGQLDNPLYVDEIKKVFPKARYIASRGALYDFQLIRSAKNVAISVSTFSWLAAWLSHAENIFYPLAGFLNPALQKAYNQVELFTDFASTSDERFRFFQMPFFYNEEISSLVQHHTSFYGKIYEVPPEYVDKLKNSPFIKKNKIPNRLSFRDKVDPLWYLKEYPIAAQEISEGYYSSPSHHYEEIGWIRNYSPFSMKDIPENSVLVSNFCKASQSSVDLIWSHGKTLESDASTLVKEYNSPKIFNHTELQKNAWWCVDLGKNWDITCIAIQNRTENLGVEKRLFPFFIESSMDGKKFTKIASFDSNTYHDEGLLVSIFNQPIKSCFIRIFLPGENRVLSICQVRIYTNNNF
ncbi:discoidin domain-containing protein, partial [Acetobacter aceti]|uniref:discoidin domain-containing protein n=1 Tax=Acetobacter aceti TaxID=435 RepID=UPI0015E0E705